MKNLGYLFGAKVLLDTEDEEVFRNAEKFMVRLLEHENDRIEAETEKELDELLKVNYKKYIIDGLGFLFLLVVVVGFIIIVFPQ